MFRGKKVYLPQFASYSAFLPIYLDISKESRLLLCDQLYRNSAVHNISVQSPEQMKRAEVLWISTSSHLTDATIIASCLLPAALIVRVSSPADTISQTLH